MDYRGHVRFGSKADVTLLNFDVRFTPESGHWLACAITHAPNFFSPRDDAWTSVA
jgi:hypothetical protein